MNINKNLIIALLLGTLALQPLTVDAITKKTQYRLKNFGLGTLSTGMALTCSASQLSLNLAGSIFVTQFLVKSAAVAAGMLVAPVATMRMIENEQKRQSSLIENIVVLGLVLANAACTVGTVKGSQWAYDYFKQAINPSEFEKN